MTNDWILDALADMRNFAAMNGMSDLARQLDITADVARREIQRVDGVTHRHNDDETDIAAGSGNPPSR